MGRHVEWASAHHTDAQIIDEVTNEYEGDFESDLDPGNIALVLNYSGDLLVLEAENIEHLRSLRNRITNAIQSYTRHHH